jgi:hypothetical protein
LRGDVGSLVRSLMELENWDFCLMVSIVGYEYLSFLVSNLVSSSGVWSLSSRLYWFGVC